MIKLSTHINPYIWESGFWDNPQRYRVLYGGRSSSKSHEFATMCIIEALQRTTLILCTRAFQNKIKDSVKSLLESKIESLGVSKYFKIGRDTITCINGSRFAFYGLSRNIEELKSIEGVDICYIEEAHYITAEMYKILAPTIRKEGSEIWISFNPKLATDFVYNKFIVKKPKGCVSLLINYNNNPYLSNTMLAVIEEAKKEEDFNNIYLGECKGSDDLAVISKALLTKRLEAPIHDRKTYLGVDIGDGGSDPDAITVSSKQGVKYSYEFKRKRGEFKKLGKEVMRVGKKENAQVIIYDSIGVGAGFGTILKGMKTSLYSPKIEEFVASQQASKKSNLKTIVGDSKKYGNMKAQFWVLLRELLKREEYKINPDFKQVDDLLRELSSPWLIENENKILIEKKIDMLKRGIKSPNLADSVIMALFGAYLTSSW